MNGTVVDDLCNLFTQAKTLNVKNDTEWKVVYVRILKAPNCYICKVIFLDHVDPLIFVSQATLMTVALKDDLPKTNRTIYDVRQSFHDGMQKAAVAEPTIQSQTLNSISSETAFLKELESMLSTELDASDTEEALDFAKEVYQKTNSNKDVSRFYSPSFGIGIMRSFLSRSITQCWYSITLWDYRRRPFAISWPETRTTAMNLNLQNRINERKINTHSHFFLTLMIFLLFLLLYN